MLASKIHFSEMYVMLCLETAELKMSVMYSILFPVFLSSNSVKDGYTVIGAYLLYLICIALLFTVF